MDSQIVTSSPLKTGVKLFATVNQQGAYSTGHAFAEKHGVRHSGWRFSMFERKRNTTRRTAARVVDSTILNIPTGSTTLKEMSPMAASTDFGKSFACVGKNSKLRIPQ